jgi:hypothetical protein
MINTRSELGAALEIQVLSSSDVASITNSRENVRGQLVLGSSVSIQLCEFGMTGIENSLVERTMRIAPSRLEDAVVNADVWIGTTL